MKKYRVYVTMTTYLHKDILAVNETDALEKAEEMDGGDFVEEDQMAGGWDITHATLASRLPRVRK